MRHVKHCSTIGILNVRPWRVFYPFHGILLRSLGLDYMPITTINLLECSSNSNNKNNRLEYNNHYNQWEKQLAYCHIRFSRTLGNTSAEPPAKLFNISLLASDTQRLSCCSAVMIKYLNTLLSDYYCSAERSFLSHINKPLAWHDKLREVYLHFFCINSWKMILLRVLNIFRSSFFCL